MEKRNASKIRLFCYLAAMFGETAVGECGDSYNYKCAPIWKVTHAISCRHIIDQVPCKRMITSLNWLTNPPKDDRKGPCLCI